MDTKYKQQNVWRRPLIASNEDSELRNLDGVCKSKPAIAQRTELGCAHNFCCPLSATHKERPLKLTLRHSMRRAPRPFQHICFTCSGLLDSMLHANLRGGGVLKQSAVPWSKLACPVNRPRQKKQGYKHNQHTQRPYQNYGKQLHCAIMGERECVSEGRSVICMCTLVGISSRFNR